MVGDEPFAGCDVQPPVVRDSVRQAQDIRTIGFQVYAHQFTASTGMDAGIIEFPAVGHGQPAAGITDGMFTPRSEFAGDQLG